MFDIASGFHHLELDGENIPKTAFSTHNDHYEYLGLPFGNKISPAVFARIMKCLFDDLLYKGFYCYVVDLILYSRTFKDHLSVTRKLLERLRSVNLTLRASKCKFAFHEIKMLGKCRRHTTKSRNVAAIVQMPRLYTVKLVRSFLGSCSFFRRFIKDFSATAKPLNNLTKNDEDDNIPKPVYIIMAFVFMSIKACACIE